MKYKIVDIHIKALEFKLILKIQYCEILIKKNVSKFKLKILQRLL